MFARLRNERVALECMLIVVVLGMMALYFRMGVYQMVTLNLFFLPIVLSGYYFGRANAGVLALLCALCVTVVTTLRPAGYESFDSPVAIGLALSVWAAALGLTAMLTGTLCDERAKTVSELQKAYVGVVDVLSKYLQSANPHVKDRSTRIAEMCQLVAREMKLPDNLLDDIRVAALLHDLENVEVTTNLITKAVTTLDADSHQSHRHTFLGTDLVHSLGTVLDRALPLLVGQDAAARECLAGNESSMMGQAPLGARIITAVRTYDGLVSGENAERTAPCAALDQLRRESSGHDTGILDAIGRLVSDADDRRALHGATTATVAS